jgi:arylsulfatase A-like enzyme
MEQSTWRERASWLGPSGAILALTLLLGAQLYRVLSPTRERRRNLVLVSMDTLRADHLRCYGYTKPTSPNIDALAARGTRFNTTLSTSAWTSPAHASLFTSRYPSQVGIVRYNEGEFVNHLQDGETTLAEVLRRAGYETSAFTGGGFVSNKLGFAQGFDEYWSAPLGQQKLEHHLEPTLDWIARHERQDRPFFLFLHFYDCHRAYDPPSEWAERFAASSSRPLTEQALCGQSTPPTADQISLQKGLYDAEIAFADDQLGRVFRALEASGHAQDTLIVFTADHGEEFKDHGGCDHIGSVYQELVHVPLVMAGLEIPAGKVVEAPVSLIDVAPTILDLLGVEREARMEGDSLVAVIHGAKPERRYQFFESGFLADATVRRGVSSARAKLIFDAADRPIELYDLSVDPNERENLLATPRLQAVRNRMLTAYLAWRAHVSGPAPSDQQTTRNEYRLDSATQQQVRALGYSESTH